MANTMGQEGNTTNKSGKHHQQQQQKTKKKPTLTIFYAKIISTTNSHAINCATCMEVADEKWGEFAADRNNREGGEAYNMCRRVFYRKKMSRETGKSW